MTFAMATAEAGESEEASISVMKEDSNHIELAIRIRDLIPRKGVSKFLHRVKKGTHPQDLVSNATFTRWILTASSLEFEAKVNRHHQHETSTSKLRIRKFPSDIDDMLVDVRQPPGREYSFLIVRARKRPPSVDWKRFLNENGTLDAGRVDEETQVAEKEKEKEKEASEKEKQEEQTMKKEKRMSEKEKSVEESRPRPSVYADNLKKSW